MSSKEKYFEKLDIVRIVSCILVFLYHLGIIKGGFFAVCTFFVLSGYLSVISLFKKDKISLKDYYYKKFIHIYAPLLIVVFLSICVIYFIKDINWINLKPETLSVIGGYNNFWQINASLDYFARHISSPFMHFWYIAILLQFELVFPFIFMFFKYLGNKIKKCFPIVIISLLVLGSIVYCFIMGSKGSTTFVYYNTLTRAYSLLLGVLAGFLHHYYGKIIPSFIKKSYPFYIYLGLVVLISLIFGSDKYYIINMLIVTIISARMIEYAVSFEGKKNSIINYLSGITYEVYLFQYPVIFIFEYINMNQYLKYVLIILIVILLSCLLSFSLKINNDKNKLYRYLCLYTLLFFASFGLYVFIISKDYTEELKALENQLAENSKIMEERQALFEAQLQSEESEYQEELKNIENDEAKLGNYVKNLKVVFLGDSVMLGASRAINSEFPNSYIDAEQSRTCYVLGGIISKLKRKNMLADTIVLNFGANGDCPNNMKRQILDSIKDKEIYWLTVTNDRSVNVNGILKQLSKEYDNLHIIDWENISKGHKNYFIADGIHLTSDGRKVFAHEIYNAILNNYKEKLNKQKEELTSSYEEKQREKITFIGNDLLLNDIVYLKESFSDANFITNSNYTYDSLIKDIEEKDLSYKVVFLFDNKISLNDNQVNNIISKCSDHKIYFVSPYTINNDNASFIDFYKKANENEKEYIMVDRIHLTNEGNILLNNMLSNNLKRSEVNGNN